MQDNHDERTQRQDQRTPTLDETRRLSASAHRLPWSIIGVLANASGG